MKAWAPAVRLADLAGMPVVWAGCMLALFLAGWAGFGSIWGGVALSLAMPGIAMGVLLFYYFAALVENVYQLLGVGTLLGSFGVVTTAMDDGIGSSDATGLFLAPITLLLIFRAIHVYVSPLWTDPEPD